ncbi:MAG: CapA family protein [Synergistaceae bacterium]|nr:CapA family protein [Synergistaceae bacterium]
MPKFRTILPMLALFVLFNAAPAAGDETIRARAVFVGDVMVHKEQLAAAQNGTSWDFKPQVRRTLPLFWDSLAVGNLETVFAGEDKKFSGYPAFNTPDALTDALNYLGMDIVTLANNHIMDKGLDAAARTTKILDEAGIFWTGLASRDDPEEPLIVEYAGLRWGFVNYSYGSNIRRTAAASEDLALNVISNDTVTEGLNRAMTYSPDILVACLHWGNEYQHSPTKRQRDVAALCLKNGADIVIGTHPHVLQPIEITSSDRYSAVAYSLGNFISFQRTKPRERSVALAVDVEKEPGGRAVITRVSVAPTWVSSRNHLGKRLIEAVYAGEGGPFNHADFPESELESARQAGRAVLEFLGAEDEPDVDGFYTIWDSASPDKYPKSRRKTPE